jgi:hypothetical protein
MMLYVLPIVVLSGYTVSFGGPAIIKYAPELCGIAASAYFVVRAVRYGFAPIRFVYWVLMVLIALHFLFGIIANQVQVGTMIIGGRMYLRTIPFFLLALVMVPDEKALKRQFIAMLGVSVLQLPIAAYQRISNYRRALTEGYVSTTGDYVMGTLGNSAFLSIFLICFAAIIIALYARKKIGVGVTIAILLAVLVPTMINETKGTLVLIPLAVGIPMLAAAKTNRFMHSVKAMFILAGFLAIFVPTYDYFMVPRYGYGILDFLAMDGRVESYLSKGAEVGTTGPVGRLDSMSVAVDVLSKDPSTMMLGLGAGNVTESVFGRQYQGEYFTRYGAFSGTTYAKLLWEIGFVGVALVLFLIINIGLDAKQLYKRDSTHGILALGFLAIVPIIVASMLYKNLLTAPGIGVCFWYYCGVIVAVSQTRPVAETKQVANDDTAETRHPVRQQKLPGYLVK